MADDKGKQWLALQALGATLQDVSGQLRGEGSRGALDRFNLIQEKKKEEATKKLTEQEKADREYKTWQETKGVLGEAIDPNYFDESGNSALQRYTDALDIGVKAGDFDAGEAQSRLLEFTKGIKKADKEEKLYPTLDAAIKDVADSGLELSSAQRYKDGYKVQFDRPKVDYTKRQQEQEQDTQKISGAINLMKKEGASPEEIQNYIMYKFGANPEDYTQEITGGTKGIGQRIIDTIINLTPMGGINRLKNAIFK